MWGGMYAGLNAGLDGSSPSEEEPTRGKKKRGQSASRPLSLGGARTGRLHTTRNAAMSAGRTKLGGAHLVGEVIDGHKRECRGRRGTRPRERRVREGEGRGRRRESRGGCEEGERDAAA